jgi:hypothetical protein
LDRSHAIILPKVAETPQRQKPLKRCRTVMLKLGSE